MKLSVIICTYNRADYIEKAVLSIFKQEKVADDYELIVVNNNSTDNTEEIINNFKQKHPTFPLKYFIEYNQGLSFARNRGIKEATGEIVSFIDDDAIACENFVFQILTFFNSDTNAIAFGGKIIPKYETERPKFMSKFIEPILSVLNMGQNIKKFKGKKFPVGANMGFRKEVFETIGYFNTKLGRTGKKLLGGEEKDLAFRIKSLQKPIYYLPKAWIYHIITKERLTKEFIKKQARGIGYSEKIRGLENKKLIQVYLTEFMKWGASSILFIFYALILKPQKGFFLIRFRYWVSLGLLN
jgi:glycosyltransferase involved in cell wall biosynthesis